MNNRNSPFSPFPVNSVTEIRRPPYKRGVSSVIPVGGVAMNEKSFTGARVLYPSMNADFLSAVDSNNSLDDADQTMQPAPVAFSEKEVKLKNVIRKRKPALKVPMLDLFGAAVSPTKRTNDRP